MELPIAPDDEAWAAARWAELGAADAVLIVPGSGTFSTARRWAPERFVEVCQMLQGEQGLTPLVLGGLGAGIGLIGIVPETKQFPRLMM